MDQGSFWNPRRNSDGRDAHTEACVGETFFGAKAYGSHAAGYSANYCEHSDTPRVPHSVTVSLVTYRPGSAPPFAAAAHDRRIRRARRK